MNTPFVSVVMPTRNRADMLKKAIEAVEKQDYPNFEIIVVDNGSTDHTPNVVEAAPRARYLLNPIPGVSISRQKGIEAAAGEVVAMCDDDTVPEPSWLRHMVEVLMADEHIALVGGLTINHGFKGVRVFKGRGKIGRNATITPLEDPTTSDYFASMNTAFKKAAFEEIGGYDPFYRTGSYEEPDVSQRLKALGYHIKYVPESVLNHYHTQVSHRRRFTFYNSDLMRLYFFLKHFRPSGMGGWLSFLGYEMVLLGRELFQIAKVFVSRLIRLDFKDYPPLHRRLFNALSARAAIPWLMAKVKARKAQEAEIGQRVKSARANPKPVSVNS